MAEEYCVLRVKPRDLEDALNELSRHGWQIHSLIPARQSWSPSLFALGGWGRGTLEVSEYHLVGRRQKT